MIEPSSLFIIPSQNMNRKGDFESEVEDPYEVIRKLRAVIQELRDELEEYQMVCDSLVFQKNAAVKQASDLKREVSYLNQRLDSQRLGKSQMTASPLNLFQTKVFSKENRLNYVTLSPQLVKSDVVTSHMIHLSSPAENTSRKGGKSREFIPGEIVFKTKEPHKHNRPNISGQSSSESILENVGQNLIQDFMVISPDILSLKKLREVQKEQRELTLQEYYFFNYNPLYKNRKSEYLKDIAKRSFPLGAKAIRKTITDYEHFRSSMQFQSSGKMGEQYFIFNLKGDLVDNQIVKQNVKRCNPYQALFVICMKIPDFIPIRQQKPKPQKEQEVWMVEKVYAILTYFPFFDMHLSILANIQRTLQPAWHKLNKEDILAKNLQRNLTETQQNQDIDKLVSFLMNKKPDFNQSCMYETRYLGTTPALGVTSEYCIPRFTCGIFFSIFAYEEMLLLLTAMFLQKTIVFVSKSQSAATLCALFLTTVISPFRYNQHLILNCDKQKIQNIVFEFPFILVASIKKTNNFSNLLRMFIDNNCDRFRGFSGKDETAPLIFVDIDSNSILYDPQLNKTFQELIVSPSENLREAYLEVNPSNSKSFTFPKKMPVEFMAKPKNDYQKNQEQRRKLQKEYQQKIDNNTSKWPTYLPTDAHFKVLQLLAEYIQSFGINPSYQCELIVSTKQNREVRKEKARKHVLAKHPYKHKLVNVLMESQLYADYLDEMEKKLECE